MIVEGRRGIRNQIQAGDRKQCDADYGFFTKMFCLDRENTSGKEEWWKPDPRPLQKTLALKHPSGANAKQSHRQGAYHIPVVEITKNGSLPQTIKRIQRWNSVPCRRLDEWHAHRVIKGYEAYVETMPYLQIGQRELHHQEPGQHHAEQQPCAAANAGKEFSPHRKLPQER